MKEIKFEQVPEVLGILLSRLTIIEQLLSVDQQVSTDDSDQLLSIQEAAVLLKLSVPTIYGLVSRAAIPYNKKGKRLYFLKQELMDWVKSGRKKTVSEIEADATQCLTRKKR